VHADQLQWFQVNAQMTGVRAQCENAWHHRIELKDGKFVNCVEILFIYKNLTGSNKDK